MAAMACPLQEKPVPSLSYGGPLKTLPDNVFAVISKFLCPIDVCNLSLCCKSLTADDLILWRNSMASYKALCRFLVSVRPLVGMWVHQNL
ncbi:hypothetical protein AMTRI_Chr05g57990 [Amborella trichopoda]